MELRGAAVETLEGTLFMSSHRLPTYWYLVHAGMVRGGQMLLSSSAASCTSGCVGGELC